MIRHEPFLGNIGDTNTGDDMRYHFRACRSMEYPHLAVLIDEGTFEYNHWISG